MKKIIAILAVVFMSQLAIAQENATTGTKKAKSERKMHHKGGKHKKEMMKALNLNDEQKGRLKEMKTAHKQKMEAIKNNSSLTDEQKKEQMKALRTEQRNGMQSVLNDEQKQKMKDMRAKMKEDKKNRKKMKDEIKKEDTKTPTKK